MMFDVVTPSSAILYKVRKVQIRGVWMSQTLDDTSGDQHPCPVCEQDCLILGSVTSVGKLMYMYDLHYSR